MNKKVCVCGAGTMGCGIAMVAAQSGLTTLVYDVNEAIIQKAKLKIDKDLSILIEKNKISQTDQENVQSRLSFTHDIGECVADIIIEAIIEKIDAKENLFSQLEKINPLGTVFATNTSSISITDIAKTVLRPEKFIGMHFFNPATIMKLVEVVNTRYTSEHTTQTIVGLAIHLGKVPVICNDSPGFIVNRVARPYYLEALQLFEKGIGDFESIDSIMEASGFKMGPFRLMDLIGNDINYTVSCSLYDALNQPERLKPSYVQQERLKRNELGRKTGKGYYTYG